MKAKELMIGDWIKLKDAKLGDVNFIGPVVQIKSITGKHVLVPNSKGLLEDVTEEYLLPIPITPDILEKNGYKQIKGGKVMGLHVADIFNLEISDEYGCQLKIDLQDFGSTEATHWYITIQGKFSFSGYIGYLHQLQHVLRLCGVDKEIKVEE